MKALLARILCSAAHSMWQKNPTLGRYTSDTGQHELNLAFHFARELHWWFSWLDCDFDVSKKACNHERPDIILHRRGIHALNYLVIEVKREQSRGKVEEDLEQIRERWFECMYKYRYGATVILEDNQSSFEVQVLSRDTKSEKPVILKHSTFGKPLSCPPPDQVRSAMTDGTKSNENILAQELDQLVCTLYDEIKIPKGGK